MPLSRRLAVTAGITAVTAMGGLFGFSRWTRSRMESELKDAESFLTSAPERTDGMAYRQLGATGLRVSEIGFGSWGIGGQAYGAVDKSVALNALSVAEELGCNFVDTAMVYGDAEPVIGEFLTGRRSRWIVATKFSGQEEGMTRTVEDQLRRLRTDVIDFYQIHWAPGRDEGYLYEDIYRLKKAGKIRFAGVSLNSGRHIDFIADNTEIDGIQVPCSLLDPFPFLDRLAKIRARRLAVVIRSSLREGFLTGKYTRNSTFTDEADRRRKLSRDEVVSLVDRAERFRFLEAEYGSMAIAAARYPLSFPEASTVILGTKDPDQARVNFGTVPGGRLSAASLARIQEIQVDLGSRYNGNWFVDRVRSGAGL